MSDNEKKLAIDFGKQDWFLQKLVNIVNGNDVEFGITLNVGGFLVSGLIVSGHKYFENFANEFCLAFNFGEQKDDIFKSFADLGLLYTKEKKDDDPPPMYIHMKNAKFYNTNGSPIPNNTGIWWRGRVSEVSGFTLGILSKN